MTPSSPKPRDALIYEQAVGERIRTLLRIDFLMRQFEHHHRQTESWDKRAAIGTLLELFDLVGRHNIKLDLIRELDQRLAWLKMLEGAEGTHPQRLRKAVRLHESLREEAHALDYPVHRNPFRHELLHTLSQRLRMPGCGSETDLPMYQNWLANRQLDHTALIRQWSEPLEPIVRITRTILDMIRRSAAFRTAFAQAGWHEEPLDPSRTHQMIRIRLPAAAAYYPEISIDRRSFSIVFRDGRSLHERPAQTGDNVEFELACCLF